MQVEFSLVHLQLIFILHLHSLEWWSFELLVLLSGFLPNPKLEASVLSIRCGNIFMAFFILGLPFSYSNS
jgi:hypothetical protein